jgi:proteasome lid subunit RPN8/RPN11
MLNLPEDVYARLLEHLLPGTSTSEEAAFVFVHGTSDRGDIAFRLRDWFAVPPEGFVYQSDGHLELTDRTRAQLIKRAHDLGASIVEFHSHPYPCPATFSESDREGFEEFLPHVWWRLKGKPYLAVVVSPADFDGLVWLSNPSTPQLLDSITAGERVLRPTGLTLRHWRPTDEY